MAANPFTQKRTLYCERRVGFTRTAATNAYDGIFWRMNSTIVTEINSAIGFLGSSALGTMTGHSRGFIATQINEKEYVVWVSTDYTGWFLAEDSFAQTSYTGDTHSNTTVDNIASTAGMYAGQAITGSGIPANTRIASVDSGTQITLTAAATATSAGVTLTKEPIAKILDADYPGNAGEVVVGTFASIDGYLVCATYSGRIYNSDLNSVTAWSANSYVSAQERPDPLLGVIRLRDHIVALGTSSIEFFGNDGNTTGSPFGRRKHLSMEVGCAENRALTLSPCAVVFDDILYWMTDGAVIGQVRAYTFGGGVDVLSTGHTQTVFAKYMRVSGGDLVGGLSVFEYKGSRYLHVAIFNTSTFDTIVDVPNMYWIEGGIWHRWELVDGTSPSSTVPFGKFITAGTTNVLYCFPQTNTGYYFASNGTHQDNATGSLVSFTRTITTGRIYLSAQNNRVILHSLRVIGDYPPLITTTDMNVSVSFNDGTTFSTARAFSMNTPRPQIRRLGSGYGPKFRFTDAMNEQNRIEAFAIEFDECLI